MNRFVLAWICFFRLLIGKKLPTDVVRFLPEGTEPPKQLPEKTVEAKPEPKPEPKPVKEERKVATSQHHRDGALALLALLQREGRLVDFLREPLDGFSDADIGAAARDVHRGCATVLQQHRAFAPEMPGE